MDQAWTHPPTPHAPSKTPASLALSQSCWLRKAYSSHCARVMPYLAPRFSAVMPMGVPASESVRPAHSESFISGPFPRGTPQRTAFPSTTKGAADMFSVPAASVTSAWSSSMASAPLMTVSKPEPHSLVGVGGGGCWGG